MAHDELVGVQTLPRDPLLGDEERMLDTTMRRDAIERRHIQDASDDTRALRSFPISDQEMTPRKELNCPNTNNCRWSWLIMHYRGGVLFRLLFFALLLFREPFPLFSLGRPLSLGYHELEGQL